MSPWRRQEVKTAGLEPAKPPAHHKSVFGERSRRLATLPVEATRSTSQSYSASPSSCKDLQSTTMAPARQLDGCRHHRITRYLLCCTCNLHLTEDAYVAFVP
jgi:hypothetical protein